MYNEPYRFDSKALNFSYWYFILLIIKRWFRLKRVYYRIYKDNKFYRIAYCYDNYDQLKQEYEKHGYKLELILFDWYKIWRGIMLLIDIKLITLEEAFRMYDEGLGFIIRDGEIKGFTK